MHKRDFPFFTNNPELKYLDNAATTQKPEVVINALDHFYRHDNVLVHRGIYQLAEKATTLFEDARAKLAHYFNGLPEEFVFTYGATEGINIVAHAWAEHNLQEGDEIVIAELEHHANMLPWMLLSQRKKVILRWVPVDKNGVLAEEHVIAAINKKTKLVAITHTSHVTGQRIALQAIIAHAHEVGARVLVDAAQAVAHQRIDLHRLSADFLVFSAHKMFGPTGVGVLFICKDLHHQLKPVYVGGGMVSVVTKDTISWRAMPQLLEAGTQAISDVIGLGAALDYLATIDFTALQEHETNLLNYLIEELQKNAKIRLLGPIDHLKKEGSLLSFTVEGHHPHDVAAFLDTFSIAVRAGDHCAQLFHRAVGIQGSIRISLAGYTTKDDIEAVIDALKKL